MNLFPTPNFFDVSVGLDQLRRHGLPRPARASGYPVTAAVAKQSDYLLIHGNGPHDPALIKRCIAATRELGGRSVPVMINRDPSFHFTESSNHLLTSVAEYTSWGYYEQGQNNYQDGFQSPPVNWTINTDNKRQFFELGQESDGSLKTPGTCFRPTKRAGSGCR